MCKREKLLIAHECPLSIMKLIDQYTDYSYALVHLFEKFPSYLEFFKKALANDREVILDNSLFELREMFDPANFASWIEQIRPTYYVIPDVWEKATQTIESCRKWITFYSGLPGKTIGVVQATTYKEAVECYKYLVEVVDKVAFNFENCVYSSLFPHPNKRISLANGRLYLISRMLEEGIINTNKPHHLLGVNLPQEVLYYKDMKFFDSIDTSNPVVHGLKEIHYFEYGLLSKEEIKLADLIAVEPTAEQISVIIQNISRFRRWVKGI